MEIANALSGEGASEGWRLTVEEEIQRMAKAVGEKVNNRKLGKFRTGRADVVVWKSYKSPTIIIEVKRNSLRWRKDAKRIRQLVDAFETVKWGVFVCFTRLRHTGTQDFEGVFHSVAQNVGASNKWRSVRIGRVGINEVWAAAFPFGRSKKKDRPRRKK